MSRPQTNLAKITVAASSLRGHPTASIPIHSLPFLRLDPLNDAPARDGPIKLE